MKTPIQNPFTTSKTEEEYQCFGCSPYNKQGLKLTFTDIGEQEIETIWKPESQFEGFFNMLHGGIQATLHDETAGWFVFSKCGTSGVTQSLHINYLKHVFVTDEKIRITATLKEKEEKKAIIITRLYNSSGEICSEAEVAYFLFPEPIAKRKFNYPGAEKFYHGK